MACKLDSVQVRKCGSLTSLFFFYIPLTEFLFETRFRKFDFMYPSATPRDA